MEICGLFHTHTPLTHVTVDCYRVPGPSRGDSLAVKGCPEFVYDYSASKIYNGHDKNSEAKIYDYGLNQRKSVTIIDYKS